MIREEKASFDVLIFVAATDYDVFQTTGSSIGFNIIAVTRIPKILVQDDRRFESDSRTVSRWYNRWTRVVVLTSEVRCLQMNFVCRRIIGQRETGTG